MQIKIGDRKIGPKHRPLVIAEVGINHNGDIDKAKQMVDDAYIAGAECVKFQHHIVEDEMIPNKIVPSNATETIWEIMKRCSLTIEHHKLLKSIVEQHGMIYLCTPFGRQASDELESIGVKAYKIGSGECNNYPLIKHVASFGKPIILSTGMNDMKSVKKATDIIMKAGVEFAVLHCTSMYPAPHDQVRLGALEQLKEKYRIVGFSDHSIGNYASFAAVALGACIIEKHFTSSKEWSGEDINISVDRGELNDLIIGCNAVHSSLGGSKKVLLGEQPTIDFAYACVVSTKNIGRGEFFSKDNVWVKRPGTGEIKAESYNEVLGKRSTKDIKKNKQIKLDDTI